MRRTLLALVLSLAAVPACGGDDPVDAAGTYSINVANRSNACEFPNWDDDGTAASIPVEITQNGNTATAEVGGATGVYLDTVLGSRLFTGTVDGNNLNLRLVGTTMASSGTCDYTVDAVIDADLSGDLLEGELRYEAKTDGSNECGALTGCASVAALNGARPPS